MSKEIKLNVPVNLSGITLSQYQAYLKMLDKWDKKDEKYLKIKLLQIFCDLTPEETYKISLKHFNKVIDHLLMLLSDDNNEFINKFSMTDRDGNKIDFGFIPNLDKISFGELSDLESYIQDWDKMHKAMAILFRPIIHNKKDFYLIEEYEGSGKWSDVMLDMPLDVALGANVFFYRLGRDISAASIDYLQQTLKKEDLPQQLKQLLGKDGGGITLYLHLLKEMLHDSMKLPVPTLLSA